MNRAMRAQQKKRESMRLALILCLCAVGGNLLLSYLYGMLGASGAVRVFLDAVTTCVCFGLTAWLGLRGFDTGAAVPMGMPSMAQIRTLSIAGVLAIAPVTLLVDIPTGILARVMERMGAAVTAAESAPVPVSLFTAMLVRSALLAPVCEELFFRGYLMAAFCDFGAKRAALATALLFALAHGLDAMFIPRALLGLLLAVLMLSTGSVLTPMIVHACYNGAVLLAAFMGLDGLFSGLSMASCAVRLIMCAGFFAMLHKAWTLRGTNMDARPGDGRKLTVKQWALLTASALALIATLVYAGVAA